MYARNREHTSGPWSKYKKEKKKKKKTTVISLKYCTAHILGSQCGFLAEGCIAIIM